MNREIEEAAAPFQKDAAASPLFPNISIPQYLALRPPVVQPDLCVICDPTKLDDRGCSGAPDLIIEILSPGNSKTEMRDKFELYQEAGVLEYWLVSPIEKTVQVFKLNDEGIYIGLAPKISDDKLTTPIIPNMEIDLMEVFAE